MKLRRLSYLSPVSSKCCSHWTYASIFTDVTFKWKDLFWVQRSVPNSNPSGIEVNQFSKMKSTEMALHFTFTILNIQHMLHNTVAPENLKKQTLLLQAVGAQICQALLKPKEKSAF